MIDEPTVTFQLTLVYTSVCQADHLRRTPWIEKKRGLEANAGPIDLLSTMERNMSQHRVIPRLTKGK